MINNSNEDNSYTLEELCEATQLDKRTVRFYIQNGVLDRPTTLGPNARYTQDHYAQIQKIKELKAKGYSLQKIKTLKEETATQPVEPLHIGLAKGVAIQIDLAEAGITAQEVGRLIQSILEAYQRFQQDKSRL